MTGNKITWDIGLYNPDTHYVYRSDAPMDPNSLPTPIATLGQGISVYEDTNNIVEGNTYYYRVDAEKMGLYIPGYEIEHFALLTTADIHDVFGDNSVIATYKFDGDATDLGGNYNGTWDTNETYDTGFINQAAKFNNNGITFSGIPLLSDGAVSFFANFSTYYANYSRLLSIGGYDYNVEGWNIFIEDTGEINLANQSNYSGTGVYINRNTDYHIVFNFSNSSDFEIYVNKENLANQNNSFNTPHDTLEIGYPNNNKSFDGIIDQFRLFNRPLTQTEIDTLYDEGFGA